MNAMTYWGGMAYALFSLPFFAEAQVNVLTYHNDNSRAGANLDETILTPANVNPTTFGQLFSYNVDGDVFAQPLYVSGLNIPGQGTHNVVFVATENNSVYAFDADSNAGPNGGLLWHVNLGNPATTPNSSLPFQIIQPVVGITGTPVIDPGSETLYVDAFTQDGTNFYHSIHALSILDGSENPPSPVVVSVSVPGVGAGSTHGVLPFQARQELQRSALTLANGVVYVAYAGYTDTQFTDPYHGWIIGFDASTLQMIPSQVFNTTPNGTVAQYGPIAGEGGIWMGGGGPAVDAGNNLFFATGDGNFNAFPNTQGTDYGSSVIKLSTSGGLSVADYFTPYNQSNFQINNLDVGSGGFILLPDQPGPFPHLLVGGGKPQAAYLINRDIMTSDNQHINTSSAHDNIVQTMPLGGGAYDTPAYFNEQIYYIAAKDVIRSYVLSNGTLVPDLPGSAGPRTFPFPGATPFVSANGPDNGIVWAIQNAKPAVLAAYDAGNVANEIYNSAEAPGGRDQLTAGVKFAAPIVANGKVYVGSQMALSVFGLLASAPVWQPAAATYNGLFSQLNDVTFGTSGSTTITTTKQGGYSAKLQLGAAKYSFHGKFDADGAATATISQKNAAALTVALQVKTNDNSGIFGTVSGDSWTANLLADRTSVKLHSHHLPFAGNYSLTFSGPGDNNPSEPQNNGTGQATINSSGSVKFKGTLGDGTKVSESGMISQEGDWGMFISLYKNEGEITGWLIFDGTNASGQTTWIKLPDIKGKQFTNGFVLEPPVSGSTH